MTSRRVVDLSGRLSYWTEPHPKWKPNPEWPEEVGCVLYTTPEALILIDPLIRDDLNPQAWDWLDRRVATAKAPVAVLLTAPWHKRSTPDVIERYDARVWIDPSGRARLGDYPELRAIPEGIEPFRPRGVSEGEVAFFIVDEQALIVAEFFLGTTGGLQVLPSPAMEDISGFAGSLAELKQLPIERVLVAHGPPVLTGGDQAISNALEAFRSG